MNAKSPDAFVEFAKNSPVHTGNKIIAFLSSERARTYGCLSFSKMLVM
jgi:hypothetical protein